MITTKHQEMSLRTADGYYKDVGMTYTWRPGEVQVEVTYCNSASDEKMFNSWQKDFYAAKV